MKQFEKNENEQSRNIKISLDEFLGLYEDEFFEEDESDTADDTIHASKSDNNSEMSVDPLP